MRRRKGRLTAIATAAACSALMLTALPGGLMAGAQTLVSNDFERSYEGWHGSSEYVVVTAENGLGADASRGMTVSGRKTPSDGASSSKGLYLSGGVRYDYSVRVLSDSDDTFRLTVRCVDLETGEETFREIASEKVKAGEWTTLSGSFKAPKNSAEFEMTVRSDSTADFRFDDFKVTGPQTQQVSAAEKGLKDEFANYFRVGNILNGQTVQDSTITAMMIKDFNSIECENETKPDGTMNKSQSSGNNIAVSLNGAASIMDFCSKNNIGMRGHTMVWHSQTPQWVFKENFDDNGAWVSVDTMNQRMESYIKNMFEAIATQYPDLNLYAYDVCNECMTDDTSRSGQGISWREPGYGNGASPWVQIYGNNDFIDQAFTYARKYAPEGCDLYYNDYNEYWDHKRDNIYAKAKDLYERGLLDGVGMQSHVPANATGFAGTDAYIEAMRKYLSIGCDVQVTELDISVENGTYTYTEQADKYKAIFEAAMDFNTNPISEGRVTAVCIWGPNDAHSWLSSGSNALLYDANNQPKEAYSALTSIIPESEWGDGSNYQGSDPKPVEPDENGWYFHHTYEAGTEGWKGRGPATVETTTSSASKGQQSLSVSGRTDTWNGAAYGISSRAFKAGEKYSFSVDVCYDGASAPASELFHFTLEYTGDDGEAHYDKIASGTLYKGEWAQLANENYQIPDGATGMSIYVETDSSLTDFMIDEAIGAVAGTKVDGAGQATVRTPGDIDGDGVITAADLSAAKMGVKNGFADASKEALADVDGSGTADADDVELIRQYVVKLIDSFPKASTPVDTAKMEQLFAGITPGESLKKDDENNPLYTQRFGADPGFMVYKDTLYVFMTNDAFEYDDAGQIKENSYDVQTINCLSTKDLVNWTDHGAIPVAGSGGIASWAFDSWAPDACWKTINGKDKFFLYFANSGGGIGVLTADSPTGPWTDPLGHALVTGQTPNCSDVVWMFDPAVLVDDDGTGYLYFGGGVPDGKQEHPDTGRAVQLGDDMISLAGDPVRTDPPYLFEDSSILKIGDTYYYSYCTGWNVPDGNPYGFGSGEIAYMTSSSPLGPFTCRGRMFPNPGDMGGGGNNHHSLVEFKGKYYILYHCRIVEDRQGINLNYRSPAISEATVSADGTVSAKGTLAGCDQLETLNPYTTVEAETMAQQSGINVSGVGNTVVTDIGKGDWIRVRGVDFSKGCSSMTVKVSSADGAAIKICAGGPTGKALGYVDIPAGTSMTEITVPLASTTDVTDLTFVFSGALEFDSWSVS